jgi:hypothetical protein
MAVNLDGSIDAVSQDGDMSDVHLEPDRDFHPISGDELESDRRIWSPLRACRFSTGSNRWRDGRLGIGRSYQPLSARSATSAPPPTRASAEKIGSTSSIVAVAALPRLLTKLRSRTSTRTISKPAAIRVSASPKP